MRGRYILICLLVFFGAYYLLWSYPLDRDVWSPLDRAQLSAESEEMYRLVDGAMKGLSDKKGLFSRTPQTEGHCALFFKTPNNDLGAQWTILKNIRTRLARTNGFDKNSVEYQAAIDDIRGTIRELQYLNCWIWHWK